eukprot:6018031-Amphidinium_carterae.1
MLASSSPLGHEQAPLSSLNLSKGLRWDQRAPVASAGCPGAAVNNFHTTCQCAECSTQATQYQNAETV